ncbi:alpha/beta hydrolase [Solitalea lacus]|uniref:alpha/beta hydrolase n=1 Tax=Solitalea lacus TaxID=2911172 RepID=UPI001EDC402B|nr:alpha/beta hydrolase-fold protein [Solitalea lacus]UKJ07061.1 hypothetical protein L2B55_16215 [Solitalea lacus]
MERKLLACFLMCLFFSLSLAQTKIPLKKGSLHRLESFHSKFVSSRKVDIWLPPNYQSDSTKRYAVIYMHDGQNLFMAKYSHGGVEWRVDEKVAEMMQDGKIKDCIVVGIWNTSKRMREYMPNTPYELLNATLENKLSKEFHGKPLGDAYLKFITQELKPYIDKNYNTLTDKANTCIMGSSMGALISLYAICEYPDVFGSAACMSTHWPLSMKFNDENVGEAFCKYLNHHLPSNSNHKIYFDYGTKTLDSLYAPYQTAVDKVMREEWPKGNWTTIKYVEDEHGELYWQRRFGTPLEYLMGK